MNRADKGILTIRYVNGSEEKFEYNRFEDEYSIAAHIKEALRENHLLLELEDRLVVIPYQSILSLDISPPPTKLPATALRKVVPIST
ncbi:MAG: hypothetical protein QNL11_09370 [Desulfobacterales bacterium]|jgi:hypothetical protein|nr:hypothetical protein [Desulfobacterales bacterium]